LSDRLNKPVVIVGAGLAGLSCARYLANAGVPLRIFERADAVGGRVRTDRVEGFQLDRGFQVLQTAYPEARALLDYDALELHALDCGAVIYSDDGNWVEMLDPWRHPAGGIRSLLNGIGTLKDRWRLARLRYRLLTTPNETLLSKPDESTEQFLLNTMGFSRDIVDHFFRPWFAGIFLERGLASSSRLFCFIFKMLSTGPAAVPRAGMQAIPEQLAAGLPSGTVALNNTVEAIAGEHVQLASGESVATSAVVVAAAGSARASLLGPNDTDLMMRSTRTLYFTAPRSPIGRPQLLLAADSTGPINNLAVMSDVAASYSASGQALISVSVIEPEARAEHDCAHQVRQQMRRWFGPRVDDWRLIGDQWIDEALPVQRPDGPPTQHREARIGPNLYQCGDCCDTGSLNGAMASGRRAAESILADRGGDTSARGKTH